MKGWDRRTRPRARKSRTRQSCAWRLRPDLYRIANGVHETRFRPAQDRTAAAQPNPERSAGRRLTGSWNRCTRTVTRGQICVRTPHLSQTPNFDWTSSTSHFRSVHRSPFTIHHLAFTTCRLSLIIRSSRPAAPSPLPSACRSDLTLDFVPSSRFYPPGTHLKRGSTGRNTKVLRIANPRRPRLPPITS